MDLRQYLQVLRERWRAVVLITIIFTGLAAGYAWSQTPIYSATTQVFVSTTGSGDNTSAAYQGDQFTQDRVQSYAKIIKSPQVVSSAKQALGLPDDVSSLQGKLSASAPLNTVLLNISAKDSSPLRAEQISNAIAKAFAVYVDELETPAGVSTSPVKVTITEPATTPTSPVSPKKNLDLALGILLGLALGIGVAVLRSQLDTRLKPDTDVQSLAGGPLLVEVENDPDMDDHPTIYTGDPFGGRAEAFRSLRTNLSFVSAAEGARRIVVSSAFPQEGKSSTSINLAIAYAQAGKRTILVDADLRRPSVAAVLGLNPAVGLTSVLLEPESLPEAVQIWQQDLPLAVLSSGPIPPNPSELLGSERMNALLTHLGESYDVVICDSPPLLPVTDAAVLAAQADGVVLVSLVGKTRIEQLRRAAESVRRGDADVLGVVLNRGSRRKSRERYYGYRYDAKSDATSHASDSNGAAEKESSLERDLVGTTTRGTLYSTNGDAEGRTAQGHRGGRRRR